VKYDISHINLFVTITLKTEALKSVINTLITVRILNNIKNEIVASAFHSGILSRSILEIA
jgi:hypothetical protein